MKRLLAASLVLGLAACAGGPGKKSDPPGTKGATAAKPAAHTARGKSPYPPAQEDLSKRGHYTAGGLYAPHIKDSAPNVDIDVSLIPEPEVVAEPRSAYGNRPTYSVVGKNYRVLDNTVGFVERGTASYYGNKFHGRRTSNMEVYDMYAFTAAHKSLPLPSFARVTNLENGQSVVVRVNDRGPFHDGRVVDLSYAAAVRLGVDRAGTGNVEVRALQPGDTPTQFAAAPAPVAPPRPVPPRATAPSTSMDTLVATLPRDATGKHNTLGAVRVSSAPATVTPVAAVATASAAPSASPMVASAVPPATGAAAAPPTAAQDAESWRFDMSRDGRTMTADEFDAWMVERKIRVSNGRFIVGDEKPASDPAPAVAVTTPAAASTSTAAVDNARPAPLTAASGVVLQVGSFSARDNADRALAILRGAGIDGANLHDGTANGRRVWRVRVGPLEAAAATGLASRIAGLGFGTPHPVKE